MCTFFFKKSTPVFIFFFVCRLDSTCRDNGSFTTANKHNHEFSFFFFIFIFVYTINIFIKIPLLPCSNIPAFTLHGFDRLCTGRISRTPGVCWITEGSSCKTEHFCGGSISTTNVDLVPSSMVNNLSSGLGTATIQAQSCHARAQTVQLVQLSCRGPVCQFGDFFSSL